MQSSLLLQSIKSRRTMVTTIILLIALLLVAIIPAAVDALSSSSSSSSSVRNNNSISQTIINSIAAKAAAAAKTAAIPTKLVATTASSVVLPKLKIKTKFILMDTINGGNIGSAARAMKTMGFQHNLILVNPKDGLSVKNKKRTKESTSGAIDVLHNSRIVHTVEEALDCSFDDDDEDDNDNSKEISSMDDNDDDDDDDENDDDNTTNENNIITIVCGTGMPIDMSREREEQLYIPPRQFFEELLLLSSSASAASAASTTTTTPVTTIHLSLLFGNEKYGMNHKDIQHYCPIMLGIPTNPKFGSLNLASAVQILAYDWRMAMNNQ